MRLSVRWALPLLLGACAPAVTEPTGPLASASQTTTTKAPITPPQYVPRPVPQSQVAARSFDIGGHKRGVLLGSRRAIVDDRGGAPVLASDEMAIQKAVPLPDGAGFLFFTGLGISRAKGFVDPLEPLVVGSIDAADIGPGFLLARKSNGQSAIVDLVSGKPKKGLPQGLATVAASPAVAIGLAHGGRVHRSVDRGATWKDVTSELTWSPTAVDLVHDTVSVYDTVVVSNPHISQAARADASSFAPVPVPRNTPRKDDTGWPSATPPLEVAVANGAPFGPDRAIVAESGSIFVISLVDGSILEREPGALPVDEPCHTLGIQTGILFLCMTNQGAAVFSRPKGATKTVIEHTFNVRALFHQGRDDSLLFAGPCAGEPKVGAACVRHADGTWHDLDRPELRDNPASKSANVITWIPYVEGALIVLSGPAGGILDARTGSRSTLDDKQQLALLPHLRITQRTLVDRFALDDKGNIVGFSALNQGVKIDKTGSPIEVSPFRYGASDSMRNLVLASHGERMFQSSDYGFTYAEVAAPPLPTSPTTPTCSAAGCVLSEWLRLGWQPLAPSTGSKSPTTLGYVTPPPEASTPMPVLRCTNTGAPVRKLADRRAPEDRPGFGAELLRTTEDSYVAMFPRAYASGPMSVVEATNLRAMVTGKIPAVSPEGAVSSTATPRRVRTLLPFDPKGTVVSTNVRVGELVDAARSAGGAMPDFSQSDERGYALTVLGDAPSALLVGTASPPLWVRAKGPALALSIGNDDSGLTLASVVQTGPDEVAVLAQEGSGESSVRRLGKGRADQLFKLPPWLDRAAPVTPDALAIAADGKLAVIRVPTRTPPTAESPALLLRPGALPTPLAAWSTAAPDGSPGCEVNTGWRAVIATAEPWIETGTPADVSERVSFARVRWSADRVCIEAVEMYANLYDLSNFQASSYVVARFGKDAAAGHLFVTEGAELREPRACTLESAAR
ncbi:MAG: hypothetical protein HOV80_28410 [Polyangiaceae bacterium]|nr:hypothetical protein [Polyangiaceae bacterium]